MEPTIALCICYKSISFVIKLTTVRKVLICAFSKIIVINKVISRVIRRVYKDAVFDTTEKSLLRHKSTEKGLKTKGFRGFDVICISTSEALFLFV